MKEVSTSILSKEDKFDNIKKLNNSSTDYIHLDIMDGKFVPNTFITKEELPKVIESCNKKLDIHLMVENPIEYINLCKN
ncbi:MAG: ribulose-phosphate 3-epimerase, partial [bacterium]|nr:ribulose-phosphate 3-epimerase [bacterium]